MRNRRLPTTLLLVLLLLQPCFAYEKRKLSQEYISTRTEVVKELSNIYNACTGKIYSKYYSSIYRNCIEDPDVVIRKERCGHEAQLATEKYIMQEDGYKPCQHLKPETDDYKKSLEEVVKERGIKKYE